MVRVAGSHRTLVLFWLLWRIARKRGETALARFAMAVVIYCVFQQAVAMVILLPQAPAGLSALEPMRYLHLVYIFIALIGGCLLGKYLLKAAFGAGCLSRSHQWGNVCDAAAGVQQQRASGTAWTDLGQSMAAGLRVDSPDTPTTPILLLTRVSGRTGEDYHSFRAMAERSQLADNIKDTQWQRWFRSWGSVETASRSPEGLDHFQLADFERLKAEFGVDWVLVSFPQRWG